MSKQVGNLIWNAPNDTCDSENDPVVRFFSSAVVVVVAVLAVVCSVPGFELVLDSFVIHLEVVHRRNQFVSIIVHF